MKIDDEMLLAEMLAEVHSRGLGWCRIRMFARRDGQPAGPADAKRVCALGALHLLNRRPCNELSLVTHGNDTNGNWSSFDADDGESLGWAFRQAMEES